MKDNYLKDFIFRLEKSGIHNAWQELIWLSCHALKISNNEFLSRLYLKNSFNSNEIEKIEKLISIRESGEPLQYILGIADFFGRDFFVGDGVLIPRHDTEILIHAVKENIDSEKNFSFVDWGTGSGCIAISLLLEFKNSFAYLIENSNEAVKYAKKNLKFYNLENRANFMMPNSEVEIFISNPPYIPSGEISSLMKEVKDYEPISALDGGVDGMDFYKIIFQQSKNLLKYNGFLILEIGDLNQVEILRDFMKEFKFIKYFYDDNKFPRCMVWRLEKF